ncbi:DUF2497 domain-containing protein [Gluconobacter morbifer]|uniref:DUF2497 domain-containing protein n=1 Tax=Gluconobacter morbifer G707 TaxID=1088869 RepID=G6XI29_9PROT|nr:DUF2497 domain-containing protein [Gluconobacter morbifer]EHH68469.1 hypothetical protein GMO_12390 [Gluconobacter morbifer G707]
MTSSTPDSLAGDHETVANVLNSIRHILHDDASAAPEHKEHTAMPDTREEELTLDTSMMVSPATGGNSETATSSDRKPAEAGKGSFAPDQDNLMNPQTIASAERSLDALQSALSKPIPSDTVVSQSSGLTIEDMVRSEVRTMVRTWLDAHLPSLVEILVRAEIARLRPRE